MPIRVKCTQCGRRLVAPDTLAGKKAKCPKCGTIMPVPKPEPKQPASDEDEFSLKPLDELPKRDDGLEDDVWDWSGDEPGTYGVSRDGA